MCKQLNGPMLRYTTKYKSMLNQHKKQQHKLPVLTRGKSAKQAIYIK